MVKTMLEKDIQMLICDYLFVRGYFFWRNNTTGLFDPRTQGFRNKPKYAINGVPDIILVKDGIFIGLEVKRPKAKQSDAQATFQKNLEAVGGQYHLVYSLSDVSKLF